MKSILFFHGFNSSAETTKFTIIKNNHKHAFTVDYSKLTEIEVSRLYDKLIDIYNPDILVGHSLGGYWALRKSFEKKIPCLCINLTLHPEKLFPNYLDLKTLDFLSDDVKRSFHLEMHDEVVDMYEVVEFIEDKIARYNIHTYYENGHHRVHYLDEINTALDELIKFIELY